ncbi:MAG: hypothetical protein JW809_03975 [Pirellulales bacterium]|nr:hypothetical protein [Pirellulales bacterium]
MDADDGKSIQASSRAPRVILNDVRVILSDVRVILSEAKDLGGKGVLRFAQDDLWGQIWCCCNLDDSLFIRGCFP